jgi:hypothetical protein
MKKSFCDSNYNEARHSSTFANETRTASSVIASAWLKCIALNTAGVSHFFETSRNPSNVIYRLFYTPDGPPYEVVVDSFLLEGATDCRGTLVRKGTQVGNGGIQMLCTRDPSKVVTAIVNTDRGRGMRNVRRIELPAVPKEEPPPPRPPLNFEIFGDRAIVPINLPTQRTYRIHNLGGIGQLEIYNPGAPAVVTLAPKSAQDVRLNVGTTNLKNLNTKYTYGYYEPLN